MSLPVDNLRLVIEGRDYARWTSYSLATNVYRAPASFEFEIGKVDTGTLDLLQPGAMVEVYVDASGVDQQYIKGRLGRRNHSYATGSHNLLISGADLSHELMVSSAPFGLEVTDVAFGDVVEDVIAPWGIDLAYSNELGRALQSSKKQYKSLLPGITKKEYLKRIKALQKQYTNAADFDKACVAQGLPVPAHVNGGIVRKVKDAKVNPGESVWEFIERLANKAELKLWMDPEGYLVISRPKYDQDPLYQISHRPSVPRENNVIRCQQSLDIHGIPTSLTAFGKTKVKGQKRQPYAVQQMSEVLADAASAYGLHRPMFAEDRDGREKADFQRRAYYAMKDAEKNFHTLAYTVSGHSQNGVVWAPDTVVSVIDETIGVDGLFYVAGVQFSRGRVGGAARPQLTDLELTELGVWTPQG